MPRRVARNPNAEAAMMVEEHRAISGSAPIAWKFYHGPTSSGDIANGYDVSTHKAWCIPLGLWNKKDRTPASEWDAMAKQQSRLIKIYDIGILKTNFDDPDGTKWWVIAKPPEDNPKTGYIIGAQPGDRTVINLVPAKTSSSTGDSVDRLNAMKRKRASGNKDQNFPGIDDNWIGRSLRVRADGFIELYPQNGPSPVFVINKEGLNVKTGSTRFDHDPDQTSYGMYSVNPMSKDMPSTNTIPVQSYEATCGDVLAIAAFAISVAKYLRKKASKDHKNVVTNKHDVVPTEYIEYEDLLRDTE